MARVYVFGNEYLPYDKMAVDIASCLQGIEVVKCTSPDDLLPDLMDRGVREITILDVIKGIKKPMLVEDVSRLKVNSLVSLHDFDVGYFLNLAKEAGFGKNIKIIGVPAQGDAKKLAAEVKKWV